MANHDRTIKDILENVKSGNMDVEHAEQLLKTYEDYGFFQLDTHREKRKGFPEVIYGEGKTAQQIAEIIRAMFRKAERILVTRVSEDKAKLLLEELPELAYDNVGRTITWVNPAAKLELYNGIVNIVSAGTSDLPVVMEAAVTAQIMGCRTEIITDVGVAGIHRLFDKLPLIQRGSVTIVVAGMEGALPSVMGGLVSHPIIAVPTSVGYGAHFNGIAPLLSMLNSCSSGISVVNVDNGFGAAYNAALILRLINSGK
jgi:pyridinium-3,5-biscarboxylic acid mononucleotide synthase